MKYFKYVFLPGAIAILTVTFLMKMHGQSIENFSSQASTPRVSDNTSSGFMKPAFPNPTPQKAPAKPEAAPEHSLVPPAEATLEQEIQENPHSTPPSIINFASSLAPSMEKAKSDEKFAVSFFHELSGCASENLEKSDPTIRAICAGNAYRLSKMYPDSLKSDYIKLQKSLPARMIEILRATGTYEPVSDSRS